MMSAAAISFWNRSQKTRASTAASVEDGGAMGMIELWILRGPIRLARACSYATRNFPAQARQRSISALCIERWAPAAPKLAKAGRAFDVFFVTPHDKLFIPGPVEVSARTM